MEKVTIDRELLPCPFCGDKPELPSGEGTQYEIECSGCGQAMASVQICDLMSTEERAAGSFTNYRYADEFVERAKKQAIENWNTRATLRQPEGEGLEVVGYASECGLVVLRGLPITGAVQIKASAHKVHDVPLCRLSDAQRAIAELRDRLDVMTQCADNYSRMFEESEEECERLRVKLMTIASAEPGRHNIEWAKAMAATGNNEAYAKWRAAFDQRDKLAGLLRDISSSESRGLDWAKQINAALDEVKPCPESPNPAAT